MVCDLCQVDLAVFACICRFPLPKICTSCDTKHKMSAGSHFALPLAARNAVWQGNWLQCHSYLVGIKTVEEKLTQSIAGFNLLEVQIEEIFARTQSLLGELRMECVSQLRELKRLSEAIISAAIKEVNDHALDSTYTTSDLIAKAIFEAAGYGAIGEVNLFEIKANEISKEALERVVGLKIETLVQGLPQFREVWRRYQRQEDIPEHVEDANQLSAPQFHTETLTCIHCFQQISPDNSNVLSHLEHKCSACDTCLLTLQSYSHCPVCWGKYTENDQLTLKMKILVEGEDLPQPPQEELEGKVNSALESGLAMHREVQEAVPIPEDAKERRCKCVECGALLGILSFIFFLSGEHSCLICDRCYHSFLDTENLKPKCARCTQVYTFQDARRFSEVTSSSLLSKIWCSACCRKNDKRKFSIVMKLSHWWKCRICDDCLIARYQQGSQECAVCSSLYSFQDLAILNQIIPLSQLIPSIPAAGEVQKGRLPSRGVEYQ